MDIPIYLAKKKKTFGLRINRCSGLTSAGFLTFPTVVANLNTYLSTSIVCRGDVTTVLWSTSTFAFGSARMLCPWPTLATLVIRCNQYAANHHNHHNIHRVAIAQQLWDFQFAPLQKQIHPDEITLAWFSIAWSQQHVQIGPFERHCGPGVVFSHYMCT